MFPEYGSHRWETAQRGDKGPDCCSFPVPLVCVQNVSSNIFLSSLVCLTVPKLVAECSWHAASQPWASGTHRELAHKVCLIVSGWGCSPGLGTQLWDACCRISSSLHPSDFHILSQPPPLNFMFKRRGKNRRSICLVLRENMGFLSYLESQGGSWEEPNPSSVCLWRHYILRSGHQMGEREKWELNRWKIKLAPVVGSCATP